MSHWKNYFTLVLVRFLELFQRKGNKDHFLIVSTTGLGDTLWATPAIRALREAHPKAYIGCLTSPLGADVLKGNPYLNEILIFNKISSIIRIYFQLRKRKIGTALLFHTSQRAILPLCAVIGASQRIGTQGLQKGLDTLLTKAIPWSVIPPAATNYGVGLCQIDLILPPSLTTQSRELSLKPQPAICGRARYSHEIERRLDIVRAAGANHVTYELDFIIDDDHRKLAKKIIPEELVIGLHPGAKDRFKQWPAAHFVQVAKKLKEELGCTIVVSGAPNERLLVEEICAEVEGAKAIIQPLKVMAAVLEKLTLFITNDTGPLHLALAMKTPTIALFSPTDPAICGPYRSMAALVIQAPPTCMPCLKKKCRDPFCMRQIGPDDVIKAALEKLGTLV